MGYYLYGFTLPGARSADLTGIEGGSVEVIAHAGLAAVSEQIDLGSFSSELERNAEDARWIASRAVVHDQVVSSFVESGILPLRFATTVTDRDELVQLLAREASQLKPQLEALRGHTEWTVRIWVDRASLEPKLQAASEELEELQAQIDASPPGRGYLLRRKLRDALERALGAALPALRLEALSRLEDAVVMVAPVDRVPKPDGENPGLLEVACLLDPLGSAMLRAELSAWPERLSLRAEMSGPFAPYHFARPGEVRS